MARKTVRLILIILSLGLIILLVPLSIWWMFHAQTWVGVGFGLIGMVFAVLPGTWSFWVRPDSHRGLWGLINLILVSLLIGVISIILLKTPPGSPPPGSPVQHRFTKATPFPTYTLSNIVPEIEQVNLGFQVMPYQDPLLTRDQARRVAAVTLALYRQMDQDRNFQQLGSVLGWAYAELGGRPFDVGHYYLYSPQHHGNQPLPALLFLHGSAGNFKAYTWVWSELAEERGMVIIAPSFGFGNWRHPGGTEAVLRALDDAATVVAIDRNQVYLAGLSNGGLGVSHVAVTAPERFRGLIFISPVMDPYVVDGETFQGQWRGKPIFVVTGGTDDRVRLGDVQQQVRRLRAGAVKVTEVVYPGEDHFLFFVQRERVLKDIAQWLSTVSSDSSTSPPDESLEPPAR